MRRHQSALLLFTVLAAGACSQRAEQQSEDLRTFDVQQEPPPPPTVAAERTADSMAALQAPGVNVTAAPGVAFDYRYAFRLPTPRIGTVQEAHAMMCEKLGIEKCRITGMRYQLRGSKNIAAMLALRLDPAIARQFGKDATKLVTDNQGMLVDQEITGIDVGSRIDNATRSKARIDADIERLEAELRALPAKDARRGELAAQIEDLRRQVRSLSSSQDSDREALAGTPMVFDYGSGAVIPGFEDSSPLGDAFARSRRGFESVLAGVIVLAGTLIPIVLLLLVAIWGWRRFAPRLPGAGYRQAPTEDGKQP